MDVGVSLDSEKEIQSTKGPNLMQENYEARMLTELEPNVSHANPFVPGQ